MQMALNYLSLINASLALRLEEQGDKALLREEVLTDHALPSRQAIGLAMATNGYARRTRCAVVRQPWGDARFACALGDVPNCCRCQRENELGSEKPSSADTSDNEREPSAM